MKNKETALIKEKTLKGKIIEAIQSGDIDKIESELTSANQLLTGTNSGHFASSEQDLLRDVLGEFLQQSKEQRLARADFCLGDDFSRLGMHSNNQEISVWPSIPSTDAVKSKWNSFNN